ncbi:YcaO-like family protein [Sphaerisporangium fuscum]|uniref:YcaO-like family protein n=1 Tax=Sphaerisporangium fuscum TaxID=2835868 RepID=UPI0027E285D6|nr:YcaO-like family protein [Sphaerisporangium fuscum]
MSIRVSSVGNLSGALDNLRAWRHDPDMGNINGVGTALTDERARLISIAEALERYSTCAWREDTLVHASESELGAEYVSPRRWPRCSETEFAQPSCGLRRYDPAVPIRWVRGWSLTRRREVLVPAMAVYLHMVPATSSEMFIRTITTGAAVHADLRRAVLGGLLEVVERDSIALTWLQRLELPELTVDPESLDPYARSCHERGTSSGLTVRLFDATTDFGIPVVYGVQLCEGDRSMAQLVAATCDVSPSAAVGKLYRELASLRIALREYRGDADRVPDAGKVSVVGGAAYNAARERRDNFAFLLGGHRPPRTPAEMPGLDDAGDPLAEAVDRLRARGAEVLAVDITTDEARQAGQHVVKVMVPQAMPVSFIHAERYLATPRLYQAPRAMGYPSRAEADINPAPQPFA